MSDTPDDEKIICIDTVWEVLINNNNLAPNRFQLLQILIIFSIYTSNVEKATWIVNNFTILEQLNALNTVLSPWCIYILELIGIENPENHERSPSPDTITSIENMDSIP